LPTDFILDSFAIMALLRHEPGAVRTREVLGQARHGSCICRASQINLGEVIYTVERRAGLQGVREFLVFLVDNPIVIEEASWQRIQAAAHIKAQHSVSYADAFAIALAQEFQATVLTGDPEFRTVEQFVRVEWLGRS
jgi:predicted nucleic acid-binding protein